MSKSNLKFINEIKEMVSKQQYNKEAVNKLLNITVVSQILSEQEDNEEVKRILLSISIVGEALANKLYELKGK